MQYSALGLNLELIQTQEQACHITRATYCYRNFTCSIQRSFERLETTECNT